MIGNNNTFTGEMMRKASALTIAVHGVLPLLLSLCAVIGALHRVYIFAPNDWDYGIFSNLLWNFAHGKGWLMSLYTGMPQVNFLADHLTLLVPLLSPVFALFSSPYTLSVLHGLAFSATYFLAPLLVREIWRAAGRRDYEQAAMFLLLVLAVFKGFNGAWRFQSHMTTLVMPVTLLALIALHRQKLFWAVCCAVIVALAQERASVAVFGIGLYAMGITRNFRIGALLCLFSAMYFILAVKLVIPSFQPGPGGYMYAGSIQPFVDIPAKAGFLALFVLYWLLLPLCGKKAAFAACCALPVLGLGLVSGRVSMYKFGHHYQDLPSIFFLASAAHGLLWLTGRTWFARLPGYAPAAAAAAGIIASASTGLQHIPPLVVLTMERSPAVVRLNQDMARHAEIPAEISVFATSGIGPRLALRERRYCITPERAELPFRFSMVFVAPHLSTFPYDDANSILRALDANPSLTLMENTGDLFVYASNDIGGNAFGRAIPTSAQGALSVTP